MYIPCNPVVALASLGAANLTLHPQPARFGPQVTSLSGKLSPSFLYDSKGTPSNTACAFHNDYDFGFASKPQETLLAPPEQWIALIQRGGCDFLEKCRKVQDLGAIACVIGNDQQDVFRSGDKLIAMAAGGSGDDSGLTIPAFGIRGREYLALVRLMESKGPLSAGTAFDGLDFELKPDEKVEMAAGLSEVHEEDSEDPDDGAWFWIMAMFMFIFFPASRARRAAVAKADEPAPPIELSTSVEEPLIQDAPPSYTGEPKPELEMAESVKTQV